MEKRKQEPGITLRPNPDERLLIEVAAKYEKRSLANYCMKYAMEAAQAFHKEHPELFGKE